MCTHSQTRPLSHSLKARVPRALHRLPLKIKQGQEVTFMGFPHGEDTMLYIFFMLILFSPHRILCKASERLSDLLKVTQLVSKW